MTVFDNKNSHWFLNNKKFVLDNDNYRQQKLKSDDDVVVMSWFSDNKSLRWIPINFDDNKIVVEYRRCGNVVPHSRRIRNRVGNERILMVISETDVVFHKTASR